MARCRFKPSLLAKWWAQRGEEWVQEFDRLNQELQDDPIRVDPDMLEQLEDEFDRWGEGG